MRNFYPKLVVLLATILVPLAKLNAQVAISPAADGYFCTGGSTTLSASGAAGGSTYRWLFNNALVSGATSASYAASQAGTYRVIATLGGVSDTSTAVTVREVPPVIYVDNGVSASGTGGSWATALKTINEALRLVNGAGCATEVWVKAGTYYPTTASGAATTSRDSSFRLTRNGIGIYGGFAGTESLRSQRNPKLNITILSGNIGASNTTTDNVYNVVTFAPAAVAPAVTTPSVIDGFTVQDGMGDDALPSTFITTRNQAGGMLVKAAPGIAAYATISNCVFKSNFGVYGGALCTWANGSGASTTVSVLNSVFTGNIGTFGGAMMPVAFPTGASSSTRFDNCVFTGNSSNNGSIMTDADGAGNTVTTTVANCTFAFEPDRVVYAFQQNGATSTMTVNNSIFWKNGGNYTNISGGTVTISNSNRAFPASGSNISVNPLFVNEADPDGADNIWGTADDGLRLSFVSPSLNAGLTSNVAAANTTDITGAARIQQSEVDQGAYEGPAVACPSGTRLYVDGTVAASGSGAGWGTALKTVWEALTIANFCSGVNEIWVKAGTYYPMVSPTAKAASRDSSLRIIRNGIKLYGGFNGTETTLGARNVTANPTILSGEIGTANDMSDNSWHVMTVVAGITGNIDSTTRVDGFTITRGNGDASYQQFIYGVHSVTGDGGGISMVGSGVGNFSSPLIANCTFEDNFANVGGAAYCGAYLGGGASPYFFDCTVRNNRALDVAGIHAHTSGGGTGVLSPKYYNVRFIGNQATGGGGAAGIYNAGLASNLSYFANCVFSGNTAGGNGGAMNTYTGNANMTFVSSVFTGNTSGGRGGAISAGAGTATLTQCTFSDNVATTTGNALYVGGAAIVSNSILWGSAAQVQNNGTTTYNYSDVRGITAPANSLSLDPLFVNASDPDGADNVWGTTDDGLRLQSCSPVINMGSNSQVPAALTLDLAGSTRIQQTTVDMGAYETAFTNSYTALTSVTGTDPLTCSGLTGTITIATAVPGRSYTLNYSKNGVPQSAVTLTGTSAGTVVLSGQAAGSYSGFYLTYNGCVSNTYSGTITLADPPTPAIASAVGSNPTTCGGSDGSISLTGLTTGTSYTVNYSKNGAAQSSLSLTASAGAVTIPLLAAGSYSNFSVSANGCVSPTVAGPVVLNPPASPSITSVSKTDPTTCGGTDGSISLNGLSANTTYSLDYTAGSTPVNVSSVTSNGSGSIVISGLAAGSYSNFSLTRANCVGSFAAIVTLNPPPTPATPVPTSNTPVCSGGSILLNAGTVPAGASFAWSGPNGYTSTAQNPSIASSTTAMSGSYQLIVTVANCSSAPASTAVTVNQTPQGVTAGVNSPICANTTISLTGSSTTSGVTYSWSGPNGFSSALQNPTISAATAAMSGSYVLTATNAGATCSATATVSVTVRPVPVISGVTGSNPLTCGGTTGALAVSGLTASTAYSFTFLKGSASQSGSGTSDASGVLTITGLGQGSYSNIVVTLNGCASTAFAGPVTLSDPPIPAAPTASSNSPVCQGGTVNLSVTGLTGASFSWTGPSSFTSTSATPSVTNLTSTKAGTYSVTQSVAGCVSPAATTVVVMNTVPAQPAAITGPAAPCLNSTNTYSIAAVTGATSYVWSLPAANWTGTSTTTSISPVTGSTSGTISVAGVNGCGTGTTRTLSVSVNTIPGAAGAITGPAAICNGAATTYSISAVSNTTGYTWVLPSGWTGISTGTSITATPDASSGTIYVLPVNACGAGNSASLSVAVTSIPAQPGTITGSAAPCIGSSQLYYISAVSGATNYVWTYPGGGSPAWSGVMSGTSVSATVGMNSGNVSVVASNQCGSSLPRDLAVAVTQLPAAAGVISGKAAPCVGSYETYSIPAAANATSYSWSYPTGWNGNATTNSGVVAVGTGSGTITVTPVGVCGNGAPASISVSATPVVTPAVSLARNTPTDTICAGTSVTFTATGTNAGTGAVYTFRRNGSVVLTGAASSWTTSSLNSGDRISVTMQSSLTCVTLAQVSDSLRMTVLPIRRPGININTQPPTVLCAGQTVTLRTNDTNGGPNPTYQWYLNGTRIGGVTSRNYTPSAISNRDTFFVEMTSDVACAAFRVAVSNRVGFNVQPAVTPSVSIAVDPAGPVPAGTSVTFTATSSNGGPTPGYQWLRNGVEISGATSDTWSSSSLGNGDEISVRMLSDAPCADPGLVVSNVIRMSIGSTGIGQTAGAYPGSVRLYPNPNTGRFTVEASNVSLLQGQRSGVDVLNGLGQTVYHMMFRPDRSSWSHDISLNEGLANGTYLLRIYGENGAATAIPFVLAR